MFSTPPPTDASSFMLGPGPPIVTGDSERGPPGCNLFVFHLPNELTNWDLYLLFRKFGTIISVHTMINKNTGLSRGFGFVSFSKEDEAIAAVRSMDGFRLGKKRLKVQRKREHEEDDEGFGPDFENFCGYSGFPSVSIMAEQMTPPSSSSSTPRYSGSSATGIALSPLSQPPTPQRFPNSLLNSPTTGVGHRNASGAGLSCPIGRMSPIGSLQHRDPFGRGQNNLSSCDISNEANHLRVSFEKECRLSDGGKNTLIDHFSEPFPEPFPGILSRSSTGLPAPRVQQSFASGFASRGSYDPRVKTSLGIRDGDGQFGIRSTGREGGNGSGLRVNLGIHTDVGKSAGLLGQIDENLGESPTVSYREDRVRDRRNSDDSFFYARRLGLLSEDSPGGSAPAPGLSLPPSSRSTHQQLYQAAYQQKQRQHEDSLQSPQLSDYEQDRRDRSRSSSASSSHSSEGKTSAELTDRDLDRDKLENGGQNGHDKGLDEDIFNEEQYRQQQYVYDENEGQYILR